jgi:outer membrane protein assembly factor BamB
MTTPVVQNGMVFVAAQDGTYALDASNGTQRWHAQIGGAFIAAPAAANGLLYLGTVNLSTGQGGVYALSASDGSQRWHAQPVAALLAAHTPLSLTPASSGTGITFLNAASGTVYVSENGTTTALNASNGQKLWSAAGAALAMG